MRTKRKRGIPMGVLIFLFISVFFGSLTLGGCKAESTVIVEMEKV